MTEALTIVKSISVRGRVVDSDMVQMRGVIYVGDDNAPAPENIPSDNSIAPEGTELCIPYWYPFNSLDF